MTVRLNGTCCLATDNEAISLGVRLHEMFERFAEDAENAFAEADAVQLAGADEPADGVVADVENFRRLTTGQ